MPPSCPAQPCLTLSQYAKSNTVFKLLAGTHHMDRPVTVRNVHNVSLESFSEVTPYLVALFPCPNEIQDCIHVDMFASPKAIDVCCAAIMLHNAYNVTVTRINVVVQATYMSGIVFENVTQ